MKFTDLNSEQIHRVSALITMRDQVLSRFEKLETSLAEKKEKSLQPILDELAALDRGKASSPTRKRTGRRGPKPGQRPGRLKEAVLAALTAAGANGLSVAQLAEKLKAKTTNIYSFFSTTGKKVKGLKKTPSGAYVYRAS